MSWFRVDDGFYSHPKVLATSLAARGLWASAGSWSKDAHTQGVVKDQALAMLGGTPELATELVTAGMWRRIRGGYRFHDWDHWQGDEVSHSDRKSSSGSIGNHKRWHVDRGRRDPECGHCLQEQVAGAIANGSQVRSVRDDDANRYPSPSPIASVVSHQSGSSASDESDDGLIRAVITRVRSKTGQEVEPPAAAAIIAAVRQRATAAGQAIRNQRSYVLAALSTQAEVLALLDNAPPPAWFPPDDAEVPDHCGQCDKRTRLLLDEFGQPGNQRCPDCHPEAARRLA